MPTYRLLALAPCCVLAFAATVTAADAAPSATASRESVAPRSSPWRDVVAPDGIEPRDGERWLRLHSSLRLDASAKGPQRLVLPAAGGGDRVFVLQPAEAMADALAARHPWLRAWRGSEVGGEARVRVETTPDGIGAMVFAQDAVELLQHDARRGLYRSVARAALARPEGNVCAVDDLHAIDARREARAKRRATTETKRIGETLRVYRLALATTAEYTAARGGAEASLASVVAAVNRVNEVFEREVGVRLQLIAGNDALIHTDTGSDGYSNADLRAMLAQNQFLLDQRVGRDYYDIGHVFASTGGGVAELGVACAPLQKAYGVSGTTVAPDDLFWIDLFAHEIGHQLDADHTFNSEVGACGEQRQARSAFEPGSGSTIMSYAGACIDGTRNDNVQVYPDANFHVRSLEQMHAYTQSAFVGEGGSCGQLLTTGNRAPQVTATPDATIPARTPFSLTASGSDPDGDAIAWSWEQFDLGAPSPPIGDDGSRPLFRVHPPSPSPTRLFPPLADVLDGRGVIDYTKGEALPTTTRTLSFRAVARDQRSGGGGVEWSGASGAPPATTIQVVDTGATFALTGFDVERTIAVGDPVTVTWNVAGTTAPPISCANVELAWSRDDGATFPALLAASTANDGSEGVVVPGPPTSLGRLRVRCTSSIFFDINHAPVTLLGDTTPPQVVAVQRTDPDPAQRSPLHFLVRWSEPVTGVGATDFVPAIGGALSGVAVRSVAGSGDARSVAVDVGDGGTGSVRLDVVDDDTIVDAGGNPLGGVGSGNGGFSAGEAYAVDPSTFTGLLRDGFEDELSVSD